MKNLFLIIILAANCSTGSAQAPQNIPYQAVLRNTDGSPMASTNVTLTFSIHNLTAIGDVVYQETHSTTTNTQGLVSLNIGAGNPVTGSFSAINWGSGAKFLQVVMNAGNGNIDLGTQQLMSVPYALYAEDVNLRVSTTGDTLSLGGSSLIIPGVSNSTNGTNYQYIQGAGVTDIDGNFYPSVIINDQEWTTQNLRVTKFSDGSLINLGGASPSAWNFDDPAYSSYLGNPSNDSIFGLVYNFYSARGHTNTGIWLSTDSDKNLCPTGWHVPKVNDYVRLLSFINKNIYLPNVNNGTIGFWNDFSEGLKGYETWPSDVVSVDRNVFGFNAQSLGYLYSLSSTSTTPVNAERGYFWSKDFYLPPSGASTGYALEIQNTSGVLNRANLTSLNRSDGAFIRCIKD